MYVLLMYYWVCVDCIQSISLNDSVMSSVSALQNLSEWLSVFINTRRIYQASFHVFLIIYSAVTLISEVNKTVIHHVSNSSVCLDRKPSCLLRQRKTSSVIWVWSSLSLQRETLKALVSVTWSDQKISQWTHSVHVQNSVFMSYHSTVIEFYCCNHLLGQWEASKPFTRCVMLYCRS